MRELEQLRKAQIMPGLWMPLGNQLAKQLVWSISPNFLGFFSKYTHTNISNYKLISSESQ